MLVEKLEVTDHVTEGGILNAETGADLSDASVDSVESEEGGGTREFGADLDSENSPRCGCGQGLKESCDSDEAFRTDPLLLLQKLALQVMLDPITDNRPQNSPSR
jgi:hypothetical protein